MNNFIVEHAELLINAVVAFVSAILGFFGGIKFQKSKITQQNSNVNNSVINQSVNDLKS